MRLHAVGIHKGFCTGLLVQNEECIARRARPFLRQNLRLGATRRCSIPHHLSIPQDLKDIKRLESVHATLPALVDSFFTAGLGLLISSLASRRAIFFATATGTCSYRVACLAVMLLTSNSLETSSRDLLRVNSLKNF
jgi:hypothetical protein